MWIGMSYRGLENGWQWEDASEVSFTQWDQGEPNNWENGENACVQFTKTGDWRDGFCNRTLTPFLGGKFAKRLY